ncbi:acid-sensing ion channel 5 [Prionailurus iriomotensis]
MESLVNLEINYSDLYYKITQQQKAVSVSELLDTPPVNFTPGFTKKG